MRRLFPLSRWAYKHFSRNLSGRAWHTTVFFSFFAKTTTRKHVRASVTEKFRQNVKASVPTCSSHNGINNNFWPYNMVTLSWQCCRVPGSGWVRWVYTGRCCLYAHASTCAHCADVRWPSQVWDAALVRAHTQSPFKSRGKLSIIITNSIRAAFARAHTHTHVDSWLAAAGESQEFTAFPFTVEGPDLREYRLLDEVVLSGHLLHVDGALERLLGLDTRPIDSKNTWFS